VEANSWYLSREGFSVAAIDSSSIAMEHLRLRLKNENLEAFLGCGDFTQLEFKESYFDCIIDVSSLCYIPEDKIEDVMKQLHTVLKPGGRIFSMTPADDCARSVFNSINDVKLNARFQSAETAMKNFKEFKDINLKMCTYDLDRGDVFNVKLWVLDAVKK
jgi:SAM-dependent methyltransferase